MQLIEKTAAIFDDIEYLLLQLTDEAFSLPLSLLSEGTIGKHIRHILEFYDILLNSMEAGIVCYDDRAHATEIENDSAAALAFLNECRKKASAIKGDSALQLKTSYGPLADDYSLMPTCLYRELSYNIEHAVHHMAIIKIAIKQVFPETQLPPGFGIASSTIRFTASQKQ